MGSLLGRSRSASGSDTKPTPPPATVNPSEHWSRKTSSQPASRDPDAGGRHAFAPVPAIGDGAGRPGPPVHAKPTADKVYVVASPTGSAHPLRLWSAALTEPQASTRDR